MVMEKWLGLERGMSRSVLAPRRGGRTIRTFKWLLVLEFYKSLQGARH